MPDHEPLRHRTIGAGEAGGGPDAAAPVVRANRRQVRSVALAALWLTATGVLAADATAQTSVLAWLWRLALAAAGAVLCLFEIRELIRGEIEAALRPEVHRAEQQLLANDQRLESTREQVELLRRLLVGRLLAASQTAHRSAPSSGSDADTDRDVAALLSAAGWFPLGDGVWRNRRTGERYPDLRGMTPETGRETPAQDPEFQGSLAHHPRTHPSGAPGHDTEPRKGQK